MNTLRRHLNLVVAFSVVCLSCPVHGEGTAAARASYEPQFDSNFPAAIRAQLLDDLGFVQGLRGNEASPLHLSIFGRVDGGDYLRYLAQRIRSVGMDGFGGSSVAYVMPQRDSSKMWIDKGYAANLPRMYRISTVFHEARHSEDGQGNWPHAPCPVPFKDENGRDIRSVSTGILLAGLLGCDVTPIGGYGVEVILLKNIEKSCASCTGKVRLDAGLYGDDSYKRIVGRDARRALHDDLYR